MRYAAVSDILNKHQSGERVRKKRKKNEGTPYNTVLVKSTRVRAKEERVARKVNTNLGGPLKGGGRAKRGGERTSLV